MADSNTLGEAFGRYRLRELLAQGGMAEIFLAVQEGPAGFQRELVIKRILPALASDPKFTAMFLDEARIAAQLSHPNIVAVFDFGEVDGGYFLAMERLQGLSIRDLLKVAYFSGQRLPFAAIARICAGVAEGLAYAHQFSGSDGAPLNIVHRDISPSNVIITLEGAPKILDFGIAKATSSQHQTQIGTLKGKLTYMPPEQVQCLPLDGRADVYALGVVLYQLLTGERPFEGSNPREQMIKICSSDARPPSQLNPDVPVELDKVVSLAMARRVDERYPSAREFCAALERFVTSTGEPLSNFDLAELLKPQAAQLQEIDRREALKQTATGSGASQTTTGVTSPDGLDPLEREAQAVAAALAAREAAAHAGAAAKAMTPAPVELQPSPLDTRPEVGQPVSRPTVPMMQPPSPPETPTNGARTLRMPTFDADGVPLDSDPSTGSGLPATETETAPGKEPLGEIADGADFADSALPATALATPRAQDLAKPTVSLDAFDDVDVAPTVQAPAPGAPASSELAHRATPRWMVPALGVGIVLAASAVALLLFWPVDDGGATAQADPPAAEPEPAPEASPVPEASPERSAETERGAETEVRPSRDPAPKPGRRRAPRPPRPRIEAPDDDEPPPPPPDLGEPRFGQVRLSSSSPAEVVYQGTVLGKTPLGFKLLPGRHRVLLRDRQSGVELQVSLSILAGQTLERAVDLRPGQLAVFVKPWGEVFVDGVQQGQTPLAPFKIGPGRHEIEVVQPKSGQREKRSIEIRGGERKVLKFDLSK